MNRLALWLATFGPVGFLPIAPGTWGSLAALPAAWLLHRLGSFPLLAGATLVSTLLGLWAAGVYAKGAEDPSEVIIDEFAGQLLALWALSYALWARGSPMHIFPWPDVLVGFLLFRLFDIWKPWPIRSAEKLNGGVGIMLDDLLAGAMASTCICILARIAHG